MTQIPLFALETPSQHPVIALVDSAGVVIDPAGAGGVTSVDGESGAVDLSGTYAEAAATTAALAAKTPLAVFESRQGRSVIGPKMGNWGDSISSGGDTNILHGNTWMQYATTLSGGRMQYVYNGGVPGENTAAILARAATVVAQPIDSCFILAGTNDTQGSVNPTVAVYAGMIAQMVAALRAAGITPIICTLPPRLVGGAWVLDRTQEFNGFLRRYAAVERLALIDFYSLLVDPVTAGWQAGWNDGDGIHPNVAAHRAMGQFVVDELSDRLYPFTELLTAANVGARNLLVNPLFLDDTNGDGIPNSWIGSDGSAGFYTHSIQSGDTAIKGNWAVITNTGAAAYRQLYQNVTTGFAAGDRMRLSFRAALTTDTAGISVNAACSGGVTTLFRPLSGVVKAFEGQAQMSFTVPAGTTNIAVLFQCSAGTGSAKLAQVGLYNEAALAALGL